MPPQREEGFTLIEVLVALVASVLLLSLVMNAAVQAKARLTKAKQDHRATLLAGSLIEEHAARPYEVTTTNGTVRDLRWQASERALDADTRRLFVLAEIEVRVLGPTDALLTRLTLRKLKAVPSR